VSGKVLVAVMLGGAVALVVFFQAVNQWT